MIGAVIVQLPSAAAAQEDLTVCAAVFPCDPNTGALLKWAEDSEGCAATYKQVCESYAVNALKSCMEDVGTLADTVSALEDQNSGLTKELGDATKTIARLKRKLRGKQRHSRD